MKDSPHRRFAATGFGMKYRMSPLSAAVARVQFKHLDERNRQRNENCAYLSKRLEPLGIHTFLSPENAERVYFEFKRDGEIIGIFLANPRMYRVSSTPKEGVVVISEFDYEGVRKSRPVRFD